MPRTECPKDPLWCSDESQKRQPTPRWDQDLVIEPFFIFLSPTVAIDHRIIESLIGKGIYSLNVFTSLCLHTDSDGTLLLSSEETFLLLLALDGLNTILGLSPEISPFFLLHPVLPGNHPEKVYLSSNTWGTLVLMPAPGHSQPRVIGSQSSLLITFHVAYSILPSKRLCQKTELCYDLATATSILRSNSIQYQYFPFLIYRLPWLRNITSLKKNNNIQ